MGRIATAIVLTLLIMNVVPFPIYGALSLLTGLQPPEPDSPRLFMLSVLVVKLGVAIAFVVLLWLARDSWADRWLTYALVWWIMFSVMEIGQAIMPGYTWLDAVGGIVAEAIYFPLSVFSVVRVLGLEASTASGLTADKAV